MRRFRNLPKIQHAFLDQRQKEDEAGVGMEYVLLERVCQKVTGNSLPSMMGVSEPERASGTVSRGEDSLAVGDVDCRILGMLEAVKTAYLK